jgi:hypothetical protein
MKCKILFKKIAIQATALLVSQSAVWLGHIFAKNSSQIYPNKQDCVALSWYFEKPEPLTN